MSSLARPRETSEVRKGRVRAAAYDAMKTAEASEARESCIIEVYDGSKGVDHVSLLFGKLDFILTINPVMLHVRYVCSAH